MGRTVIAASRRPAYHIGIDVIACIACILSLAGCALTSKGSSPAANPSISVTPSLVSFGNVKIKTQTSQTLRLSNPGTKDLVISQATLSGEGFSVSGLTAPLTVATGTSMNFTVLFQPTTTGTASASISISSNATGTPLTVSLTGTGVAESTPAISVTPTAISFGSLTVMSSATQTVTVSNTGTAALSITQTTVSGTGFSMSGLSAPVSVPAGSSTNLTVAFQPTTAGPASGSVSITSNAGPSPFVIALSGAGAGAVAPTITTQPASQTVTVGQTATFSVAANGTAPLSYQWKKNGSNISGATGTTYTTPATTTSDNGSTFTVVVTNSTGSATSNAAALTVNAAAVAPSITTQPASQTVTVGQTATFSVAANGTAPLSYQWKKNGSNISGATGTTYTTPATTTSDNGSTFTMVVTNSTGSATSNAAALTVNAAAVAPSITTQPASQTVTVGQTATFSVAANGTAPLSYQWKKNGSNISGATGTTYTIPATTTSDNGSTFTVVVTNSTGSATSNAAALTVNAGAVAPTISTQPASQTVTVGQTATFSVAANGTAPLSYQWKKNGSNISGATGTTYTIPATTTSDNGSTFTVVVTNSAGSATSNAAALTVNAAAVAPTISTQPASQTVTVGQTATFSVAANGTAPLSYQWKKNGSNISGATGTTYTTPATTTSDNGSTFTVVVTNSTGSATSNAAALTVNAAAVAPTISTQPASQTVTVGQTATFSVAANGTAPLSYQWKKNGSNISGATGTTYTTPAATTSDNGSTFTVVVTNSAGSATSNAAALTVNAGAVAPTISTQPASQTVTVGQTATFSVAANGTAPLSYQWKKNGSNISGATGTTYTTPATTTSDNGSTFTVVATNSAGSATSNAAALTVNAAAVAPTITTQPASQTVTVGQTATFSVAANGTAPLSYQWKKNGSNISGATGTTYTTPATTTSDNGSTFTVVATNSAGSATSNAAALTVNAAAVAPSITTQPASQTVTVGQTATFSVAANGTAPLSYQWKKNGSNISGATGTTYTTPATTTSDNGSTFTVVATNSAGSATSNAAALTVNAAAVAPSITTQPASQTVTVGQTATFSVAANGTAPLSYQWKKNGSNISGATGTTYTTPATTTSDNGSTFTVVATNSAGSATSNAAALTVNAAAVAPSITTQPASQTVTVGQTATFSVAANGTAPLSYQWKKNGSNISGATGTTYTTPATTTSDNGSTFTVVATNSAGSATSNAAALTVNAAAVAPSITTQPASQTVTVGQTATFSVAANGTAPLSYQWKKNGSNISGATGTTYTTPATTTSDNGSTFTVVATNSAGSATSDSAILTVSTGTQHTYSTTFPLTENPVSEGGNWIGGQSAGANLWGNVQTNGNMAFGVSEPTLFGDPTAILTQTFGPNQTVSGTVEIVGSAPTGNCCHEIELRLRMTISANSIKGYEVYCSVMPAPNQYCHIARWNGPNGSYCNIETSEPILNLVNGDVFSATVTGTNPVIITGSRNGTQIMTATDTGQNCSPGGPAGPFTSGNPGIGFFDSQDSNWSKFGFSSFSAQDNSSSSPNTLASVSPAAEKAVSAAISQQSASASETAETSTGVLTVTAPTLTIQPVGLSIVRGSVATFSVLSGGTPPLHYQWRKNGLEIEGAVDASYTTPPTSLTDGGAIFDVVVSNSAGTITSNPARLTVSLGTQKAYTTTFPIPERPISEGGNWISGRTVGLDWRDVQTSSGAAIGTDSESPALGDSVAVLAGNWKPNQMAEATVYTGHQDCSVYEGVELFLRTTIAEHSIAGYKFGFRCTSDGSQYIQILRWNGPLGNWIELGNNTGSALHSGDVLKATAVGGTLTAYVNGTALFSVRDTTYSDGSPGLGFYNESGDAVGNSGFGFSSFHASEIVESNSVNSTK